MGGGGGGGLSLWRELRMRVDKTIHIFIIYIVNEMK